MAKRIAIALGNDYEDSEFSVPYDYLTNVGYELTVFGAEKGSTVKGKRGRSETTVEATASELNPDQFDALLIPGGYSPDRLRINEDVVKFVKAFAATGKPIAAICHGPQLLIEAEAVKDHKVTSWPSVRTDLINAGAQWVDEAVVVDDNLITSRKPDDLEPFCQALEQRLAA